MSSQFTYSDAQKAAIDCPRSMVITACPGSGKTTVIVEKIRKELETLKPYQGIIGISFTIKSSKELGEKCRKNGANIKASFSEQSTTSALRKLYSHSYLEFTDPTTKNLSACNIAN